MIRVVDTNGQSIMSPEQALAWTTDSGELMQREIGNMTLEACVPEPSRSRCSIVCHLHQKNSFSPVYKITGMKCKPDGHSGTSHKFQLWHGSKEPRALRKIPNQVIRTLVHNMPQTDWSAYVDLVFVIDCFWMKAANKVYVDQIRVIPPCSSGIRTTRDNHEGALEHITHCVAKYIARHSRKWIA